MSDPEKWRMPKQTIAVHRQKGAGSRDRDVNRILDALELHIPYRGHGKSIPATASPRRFRKAVFAAARASFERMSCRCLMLNLIV